MLDEKLKARLEGARPALFSAGVSHLAVFGSRARGKAGADSDVDILIEVDAAEPFSLLDLVGVERMLSEAIGFKVNAVMRRSLDEPFRHRIAADIVEIF
jgi:predicted nucleotidyltransferase